jgi:thioredoxin-related protein
MIQILLNFANQIINCNRIEIMKLKLASPSAILLVLMCLLTTSLFSQTAGDTLVKWKKVEEVKVLMKTEPRPIFTFFYSEGVDSCKIMLEKTLRMREIYNLLNSKYYCIFIDTESNDTLQWFDNKTYTTRESASPSSLSAHLLGRKPVFPTVLIYNKETAGFTFRGYTDRYEMRCVLVYFTEDVYKTTPYELWAKAYKHAFPTFGSPDALKSPIQWHPLNEALALQKKHPRPIFINWYARLNVSSFVMLYNTYEDPKLAEYMNAHFYCVSLDAQTRDTLYWDKAYQYIPAKAKFNQLAVTLLEGKMKFPGLMFFDPQKKLIICEQTYLGPLNLFTMANYAGSGSYKTVSFSDFMKTYKPDF